MNGRCETKKFCQLKWGHAGPCQFEVQMEEELRGQLVQRERELEEALKVVRGYQVQHNVICSVESHNKITECPCENCIAARALARSTGTKES